MTKAVAPANTSAAAMTNLSKEVLLLHWKDLSTEDAERLLSVLPVALSRVFTHDVVNRLERDCQLEQCILQGTLGPLNVARTVLEKLVQGGYVSPTSTEALLQGNATAASSSAL